MVIQNDAVKKNVTRGWSVDASRLKQRKKIFDELPILILLRRLCEPAPQQVAFGAVKRFHK
jgi:hypothetical protein